MGNPKNKQFVFINSIAVITGLIILFLSPLSTFAQTDLLHEKTFDVNTGEKFILETDVGDALINSWDKNEVLVKVFGNDNAEEKLEFKFEKTSEGVFVKCEKRGKSSWSWGSGINLRYEIKIPQKFDLEISTAGGDIKVTDINGKGELKTSGGDVIVAGFKGKLVAKTSGGDIKTHSTEGNSILSTSGGDITGKIISGSVEAKTSGGDIKLEVAGGEVIGKTSGGDIELVFSGSNDGIELATSGGDIIVGVPSNLTGNLDLKTSGGDIDCDFNLTNQQKKSNYKLSGELNGGGKEIICKTTGGDIIIRSN